MWIVEAVVPNDKKGAIVLLLVSGEAEARLEGVAAVDTPILPSTRGAAGICNNSGRKSTRMNIQHRARNERNVIVHTCIERRDKQQKRERTANTGRMAKLELLLELTEGTTGKEEEEITGYVRR